MPGPGTWSAGDILTAADLNAIGTWTSYTPSLQQNEVAVNSTVNYAEYMQINKFVIASFHLTATATSPNTNQQINVSLPVTASGGSTQASSGWGYYYDESAGDVILLASSFRNNTNLQFRANGGANFFGTSPAMTVTTNDEISFTVVYQAA